MRQFVITAVLLAAAFSFEARAGEQELAVYPKTVHTRIGNDLIINGQYYRMAYFTTNDSIETVARYFLKTWNAEGYPTTIDGQNINEECVVSAFYTREGLQRSVILAKHQGKTVGFTVLKDLWVMPPKREPPAIIQLEGTLTSADVTSRDSLGAAISRTALVEKPLMEARLATMDQYAGQGFELKREVGSVLDGKQQYVLDFARGKEDVVVHLGAVDETLTAVAITASFMTSKDNAPNEKARDAMRAPAVEKKKGEKK